MTIPAALTELPRHLSAVESVLAECERSEAILAVLLVGSFAAGTADPVSDVDLIALARDGAFDRAWSHRTALSPGALRRWDVGPRGRAGAHKWLTRDLVLVECLIGEVSAVRVADPFVRLYGPDLTHRLVRRDPIPRAEVEAGRFVGDDAERLYDALKLWVRGRHDDARQLVARVARPDGDDVT